MKRLVPVILLVLAISLPSVAMARPMAHASASERVESVLHWAWSTLVSVVRSPARLIIPRDDGGGHTLPPPTTPPSGG